MKTINLGSANGWDAKSGTKYKELYALMIPGTYQTENLGRCHNEYSWDVEIDGEIIKVTYNVDSL